MVADMEVHMVADMGVDKVADMDFSMIFLDFSVKFSKFVGEMF